MTQIAHHDYQSLLRSGEHGIVADIEMIWVVRLGADLYVRSYKGSGGSWFRAAQARHEGRVRPGGVEKDVTFVEETDSGINDQIDAAYRTKYHRYRTHYVDPMVGAEARATTLKLVPRSTTRVTRAAQ